MLSRFALILTTGLAACLVSPSACAATPNSESLADVQLKRIDLDDFRGRRWVMKDFDSDPYLVVAFLCSECPRAMLYCARLQSLQVEWAGKGVRVIGVMSNRHDSLLDIQAFATRQKLRIPMLKDMGGRMADASAAQRTPEVFLFDAARTLRYRGRGGSLRDRLGPRRTTS